VTTFAYRKFMVQLGSKVADVLERVDGGDVSKLDEASAEISGMMRSTPVPDEVAKSVEGAYSKLSEKESRSGALPVAVRSSATAEDMLTSSVAGQHETFLWVKGTDGVLGRVRDCWASAFATRSLSYGIARGISQVGIEMGVVVQRMIQSRKSGVMFTLNPSNGDPSKISIDATWGLGEAEVSGVVTPDLFIVDKVTMEILTRRLGSKKVEFVVIQDAVEQRDVDVKRRDSFCLSDEEVLALARSGKELEKHFGKRLDIEWAIADGSEGLFILQARPETAWSGREGPKTEGKNPLDRLVDTLKRGQKIG
jgi:pyruvate,water dikinase